MRRFLLFAGLCLCAACAPVSSTSSPAAIQVTQATASVNAAQTATPIHTPLTPNAALPTTTVSAPATSRATATALAPTAAPSATLDPEAWKAASVLPTLSDRALAILADGLARGADPRAFSKIGDCESQTTWFLGSFDLGAGHYDLGPYEQEFTPVIDYYGGSFNRLSLAARQGFTAASLLAPIWADRQVCQKGETPLACEYRVHRPLFAFIMVGTNDATNPDTFEGHMRKVIEFSLEQSVLPILGTKADNVEGDHQINAAIAHLAAEYDLPLWNYWGAVQDLPGHGLQEDGSHLTYAAPFFDNPRVLRQAWPVRNLNALQILRMLMDATS